MVSKKASTIKTSVASKIKQIIPHETTSNQHILRFLLEIDNKLDNILEIISDSKEDDNYLVVDAIDISGGGLCFFTTEKFEKGELLYLDVELDDTTNKVEFVSVGKILNIIKTNKGFIYSLEFQNLDPDFSENIIKYVFEKERIMIQELKNK
jgi:c-di-GMP-binding flagellar brake protein YcgR